jgi:alkaline phosphatase D
MPLYRIPDLRPLSRRSFLVETAALSAAAVWSSRATGAVLQRSRFADHPFQLGVASGDPSPDGFVLWTRLATKPLEGGGMPAEPVSVDWQVAEDEQMTKVVQQGSTVATPQFAHSVHVEVAGLKPDRWYWYQFRAGDEVSPKGRTRTLPVADAQPDRLKFAFASCQHYEQGLYTAYEHMLREDLDLVVHLGDYIYEGAAGRSNVRRHIGGKLDTLDDFRNRHAQYKTDPALQAMHAGAPWLVTWDDHELENNCAGDISERADVTREQFLALRARAYQAYYEHMPLRLGSLPDGPHMSLYRRCPFGRLAEFFVLDTRQYRTDQPCGDGNKTPCADVMDPNATLLGAAQREWLMGGLASSAATWNILAQQVMMARADVKPGDVVAHSMDQWPGYEVERRQLLKHFHERHVRNPVVLTGDIHSNWANELIADFDDLDSAVVAAEFVGTSISSGGDGRAVPRGLDALLSENPFVKYHNQERGYVRCTLSPREWRSDYRMVDFVTRPGAPIGTRASFVLEEGRSRLNRA